MKTESEPASGRGWRVPFRSESLQNVLLCRREDSLNLTAHESGGRCSG